MVMLICNNNNYIVNLQTRNRLNCIARIPVLFFYLVWVSFLSGIFDFLKTENTVMSALNYRADWVPVGDSSLSSTVHSNVLCHCTESVYTVNKLVSL